MNTGAGPVIQSSSGNTTNSQVGTVNWGPLDVNGVHNDATEGWYNAVWTLSAKKRNPDGTWGPYRTLDIDETIYKVGSPTANIPYAIVQSLKYCNTTLARGGSYEAVGKCKLEVHDNAQGDRFSFYAILSVHKPDGTWVAGFTSGSHTVSGGASKEVLLVVTFGPEPTLTEGRWTTRIRITAQNLDQTPAAPAKTILNKWCAFDIKALSSSSSSSSSSLS